MTKGPFHRYFLALSVLFAVGIGIGVSRIGRSYAQTTSKNSEIESPQFAAAITARVRRANRLIYHPPSQKVYASIPGSTDSLGNSVVRIEPTTGAIEESVWVGSEPGKLVLTSDGTQLYVGLDGARAIRKVDVQTHTAGDQFQVGFNSYDGPLRLLDFAVSPFNNNVVAATRKPEGSSAFSGVAVFENGVQRANTGGQSQGVVFGDSESMLFGTQGTDGLDKYSLGSGGVVSVTSVSSPARGLRLKNVGGRIYTPNGAVLDASSGALIGRFTLSETNIWDRPFDIDLQNRKAFYLVKTYNTGLKLEAFDIDTFVLLGTVGLPSITSDPGDMVRWGTNGAAFTVANDFTYFYPVGSYWIRTDRGARARSHPDAYTHLADLYKASADPDERYRLQRK